MDSQYDFAWETKAAGDAGAFEGWASTFGNVDLGGDIVEPGAFIESIVKARDERRCIPLLWDHNPAEPIGVLSSVGEEGRGLFVAGNLLVDEIPRAKATHALMKRKGIGGFSIGYRVGDGGRVADEKRHGVFRLKKVDLREISLVALPMNPLAKITAVKSILAADGVPRERLFEEFLREAGFPKALAVAITTKAAPILRGDPVEEKAIPDPAVEFLQRLLG